LKYIFIISATIILVSLTINNYNQKNRAEVIINVNNLNSPKIMDSLEKEFNDYSGIKFIDGSLMSNTIVLEVEDNDIQISTLNQLLENWGCTIESISYRILNSVQ
tara:strand:- start:155 stop:469 length:315 start_codon:yes stop_codon:yes gene_type:complete